jgi:hypothetical protein
MARGQSTVVGLSKSLMIAITVIIIGLILVNFQQSPELENISIGDFELDSSFVKIFSFAIILISIVFFITKFFF